MKWATNETHDQPEIFILTNIMEFFTSYLDLKKSNIA